LPTYQTTRRVPFTPEQMFAIVADVERYPEFVPLCEELLVKQREEGSTHTTLIATMRVGYQKISEAFTSQVVLRPERKEIDVSNVDGPFSHLSNKWRFREAPGGCDVHFQIDYAFASRMLSLLMGAVFDKAVRKYTEAFETQARAVYGSTATASSPPARQA